MKAYLFTWNPVLPQMHIASVLNSSNAIDTWVSPFPSVAIVVSKLSLSELTAVPNTHMAGIWFILNEANSVNTSGLLPAEFWNYVNNPSSIVYKSYLADLAKSVQSKGLLNGD